MTEAFSIWKKYRPGNDPYLAAKVLETLPYFIGRRGEYIIGLFAYLRWVDNTVDERKDLTKSEKLDFLERQTRIVSGFLPPNLLPMEKTFGKLPWKYIPEKMVRLRVNIILASMEDDVIHQGFELRSERELRHYSWRIMAPVVEILFLTLNGKPPLINRSLMQLLDAYIRIGSLEGLADDLKQGVVKLPLQAKNSGKTSIGEVLKEYDEKKFNEEKVKNLKKMWKNIGSFLKLDIPGWQKIACLVYMGYALAKKNLKVKRGVCVGDLDKIT